MQRPASAPRRELEARERELEARIAEVSARIEAKEPKRLRDLLEVTVRREIPGIVPRDFAHELFDVMNAAVDRVGQVRTTGDELEWRSHEGNRLAFDAPISVLVEPSATAAW